MKFLHLVQVALLFTRLGKAAPSATILEAVSVPLDARNPSDVVLVDVDDETTLEMTRSNLPQTPFFFSWIR